ncbi:uncharacterized protein TRIADDRAFT_50915 [Trichoplax adhaerens]|uniref:CDK5 regulatory subunit-associated protein 3 n=1 Tax=Trichoplax adhaerens TaxID=10228 RepID=B3S8S3_TRIAD|nr:hypothetical protein TRIADDRAFT_50915 [Trichoplax adhaerens]EDV20936.1 hypothetical protein TRIADDRAFT_50915 [Trichoplax adhaerens]|eukprot:XP_002116580.1 hypothetical protein TRIADDRAFT_50915 [Trichoplax adhaerens]
MDENGNNNRNQAATPEAIIPIDIHYSKLLDWLIDRKHCKGDWRDQTLQIREKINNAIQDMPENDEIKQLLSGTYIHYFHCLKIIEVLKISESATKNIFGRYSSKRMKDWQQIVAMYEADSIGLAEAADMLMRNVNYEIAASKKNIGKCQQQLRDLTRKESEYTSNANIFRNKFLQTCKQIGIQGKNIKAELNELLQTLPELYDDLVTDSKQLSKAYEFYRAFVTFLDDSNGEGKQLDILPLLKCIINKGNITVYEWKTGQPPPDTIDFGDLDLTTGSPDTIDFGDSNTIDYGDSNAIDFGDNTNEIDFGDENNAIDYGDEINFDISVENGDTTSNNQEQSSTIDDQDLMTILDDTRSRNCFIDNLTELQGFFKQRVNEMSEEANIVSVNQFQDAPRQLQLTSTEEISSMKSVVDSILEKLTSVKMQHLFLIKTSERYVDRLAESLKQKENLAEKMLESLKNSQERREKIKEQLIEAEPKLNNLIAKTKELQTEVAAELSKRYQNRPVNIMGEINLI